MFKLDDDAPIVVLYHKHLSFKGRVDRRRYLKYRLFSLLPIFLLIYFQYLASQGGESAPLYLILSAVIVVILIPVDFSYMIRRWHDLGRSGWFCLINVISRRLWFVAIAVEIYLCVKQSTPIDEDEDE